MTAANTDQAQTFFLRNASGSLKVVGADGETGSVDSYPDAVAFFAEHGEA